MRGAKTARVVLFASVVSVVSLAGRAAEAPVMPHPGPQRARQARGSLNAACEGCHRDIAAEWRDSLHHASFTDGTIQRALATDPEPFCRNCHAPESETTVGVGCVTCHVTAGDGRSVLAGPTAPGASPAPHPLLRSADFATEAACASCHEFDFPDTARRRTPLAMQRTLSEHRDHLAATSATGAGGDTCLTCHMKPRAGHLDHRFAAARDEDMVKSAVRIHARRIAPDRVQVVLEPANVGHAFPTGDVFRRLRITAGSRQRFLARHYASAQELPGIVVRVETGDDRVQVGPRVVELEVPATSTRVRVVYERAEGPSGEAQSSATVAAAIELFRADL